MSKEILVVKNVSKKFGNLVAVNNVSFSVEKGEILGFIGPNGSGKSTTIKMITGLISIGSGEIFIDGSSVANNFEKAAENIGAIIESPDLFGFLTGFQNLKYFAKIHGIKGNSEIYRVADLVGLGQRLKEKVSHYSLGMKQRLGIAQALLHKPKLVILDEPTNGLDVNGIIEIRNFLKKITQTQNVSILISSHNLAELENLCTRIIIIKKGNIVQTESILSEKKVDKLNYKIEVSYPHFAGQIVQNKFKTSVKIYGSSIFFQKENVRIQEVMKELVSNNIDVFSAGDFKESLESKFLNIMNMEDFE